MCAFAWALALLLAAAIAGRETFAQVASCAKADFEASASSSGAGSGPDQHDIADEIAVDGDAIGDPVDVGDGGPPIEVKLSYISPVGNADTQSALARATLPNDQARLKPGLFVTARLILSAKQATVVVKNSAIQTLENRSVVFVRSGTKFEARDVELGARDPEQVEVLFGVADGDVYAGKNSFVVKAEIGKGSAAHEH